MKKNKTIIVGRLDKKENFGFLVPNDKTKYKSDFFVASRYFEGADDGDIVEAMEIIGRGGKSKEARILKVIEKNKKVESSFQNNNYKKDRVKSENTIVGIYSQGKGDFGFIDVEGVEKGYFVYDKNKNGALDGDKVEATLKVFRGKPEAEVIRVVERKQSLIVGEYLPGKGNNFGFVIPNNPNIKNDIFVPGKLSLEAKKGDIVGVLVTNWKGKNPEGEIKEILGKKGDKKIDVLSLIVEGGARIKFSEEVLKFAEKIKNPFLGENDDKNLKIVRNDLTNLFTFTIDGEDARDLDDAISIEKLDKGGYKLYVHIADVAEYVKEGNPLDTEAYKRGTSVYLVDRVLPMLPEKLSNDLCSLNPNTKKLTLTCEMIIGNNGAIKSQKVYESIISSDFRLTYREVDEIIQQSSSNQQKQPHPSPLLIVEGINGENLNCSLPLIKEREFKGEVCFGGKITQKLVDTLQLANELKEKITKYRQDIGVLNFDFPETKVILDEAGDPISIKEYPRYDSNKLIEEFMISANEAVSSEFSDIPFLYRIHEEPKEDDIANLQETLNLFGVKFVFKKADTKEFDKLLSIVDKLEEGSRMFLEKTILRTLSKAIYSKENFGHFGLGLNFYSHFTSPIRRYPDLQIHRIIKEKIHGLLDKKRLNHYANILEEVAKHTSDRERKAEKLEYRVRDYFIVKYYKNKVGEEFEGIISGVIPKGFFVALADTAEGFVEMENSQYLDDLKEHLDIHTGKKYRLGNKVKVKLVEADDKLLRLNFEIVL